MPDYALLYSREVTRQTLRELVDFVKWYNKHVGHEPLVVGGWAAWAYHRGIGSKDIDVVFPGAPAMHKTLFQYFKASGFKERTTTFFTYEFYKARKTRDGREVEVVIDAVSSDRRVIVSGTPITIPWALAEKHKRRFKFAEGAVAWIITPELLLAYKIGALIGRESNLATATEQSRERIAGKLWKDAQDILGLMQSTGFDKETLHRILRECGLNEEKRLRQAREIASGYLNDKQKKTFQETLAELVEAKPRQKGSR